MSEYVLDREHLAKLLAEERAVDGDYIWSRHEHFDDESPVLVYERDHVPSGNRRYFVLDRYDTEKAVWTEVSKVPEISYRWIRV